ncbi:hypothetical protein BVH03_13920 [Pseudomonas sp. PA15(2017)]|uniref:LysR family transcriptional regulator n=1 Tax=Pseudomonas sp. PA15(2017) TaxID=1932111 RepID=UPI0009612759|nr:LysR family transcriptional regulator [Pseudomonas sp. PA15(2017)]OLU27315.1 hypothetical protein BVH03_13920 [Pseudomonas sp. PA15(2017)]
MLSLNKIKFFCGVVENETIAAAAKIFHTVPSNLSLRIQDLERDLGVDLFYRENKKLLLTPQGRLFYKKVKPLLSELSELENSYKAGSVFSHLRLGVPDFALMSIISSQVESIRRDITGIKIEIQSQDSYCLEQMLMSGDLDLILMEGPVVHPLLDAKFFCDQDFFLITPECFAGSELHALSELDYYSFNGSCSISALTLSWMENNGITPSYTLQTDNYATRVNSVRGGEGFSFLPRSIIESNIYDLSKIHVRDLHGQIRQSLYFAWRKKLFNMEIRDVVEYFMVRQYEAISAF